MTEMIQIHTTTSSEDEANRIAELLLRKKLVACVQVSGPLRSYYRWHGKLEAGTEWMCVSKTLADRYLEVEAAIREVHSYEEPEVIALAISHASVGYAAWVRQSVNREEST